jgi:aminoglycoside 3-N-acetyltransferase I
LEASVEIIIKRLTEDDLEDARKVFALMAEVFGETSESLSNPYLTKLLLCKETIALAAYDGNEPIAGLTAHLIPLTRTEVAEVFIYDIAVSAPYQRHGIGKSLIKALFALEQTITSDAFVLADNQDQHALDFYRKVGGKPSPVTLFSFSQS